MNEDAPPTFAGRLRVADFSYQQDEGTRTLRSGRTVTTGLKRRADEGEDETVKPKAAKTDTTDTVDTTANKDKKNKKEKTGPARSASPTKHAGYAPPSAYAHLDLLPDALGPGLLVLFVGLNPGVQTARSGHAYAHPSNHFWRFLYRSGVTPVACRPEEDRSLPARFRLGLTNIVSRPSRNGGELRSTELDDGVSVLEAKAWRLRPGAVCLVGKSIWESILRVRYGRGKTGRSKPAFRYGWQDSTENMGRQPPADDASLAEGVVDDAAWQGARVFVASSTSGLAASLSLAQKEAIWRELGAWVEEKRTAIEAETGKKWV